VHDSAGKLFILTHPLKKRKNDPATWSQAAKPPLGGGPGSLVLSVVETVAAVGGSIFASASSASSITDSLDIICDAEKPRALSFMSHFSRSSATSIKAEIDVFKKTALILLLRAAERHAYSCLWKHCLFCRDYLEKERRSISGARPALLATPCLASLVTPC